MWDHLSDLVSSCMADGDVLFPIVYILHIHSCEGLCFIIINIYRQEAGSTRRIEKTKTTEKKTENPITTASSTSVWMWEKKNYMEMIVEWKIYGKIIEMHVFPYTSDRSVLEEQHTTRMASLCARAANGFSKLRKTPVVARRPSSGWKDLYILCFLHFLVFMWNDVSFRRRLAAKSGRRLRRRRRGRVARSWNFHMTCHATRLMACTCFTIYMHSNAYILLAGWWQRPDKAFSMFGRLESTYCRLQYHDRDGVVNPSQV
jgi:hypothetical protein